ncbi:MAPEG family protein [Flavimaricola marinus]|uniref:MAPEG family protein n=1 Tax=Flavimaricola marinus TaxID=1819565 RepID=A0A238LIM5_9RHOB|nr:MAPEG family protein [Flavimaricola marinus]SMY09478.1 MAPEG family protein [Flavimaricola marinus]
MTGLPTELIVLTILALLAASMWMPYVIGVARLPEAAGEADGFTRPADLRSLPAWIHRAHRAHLNLIEQFVPFAVLVLLLDRANGFSALTAWTTIAFLGLRIAHAAGMISGLALFPLRSILFNLGWLCCLILGYAVFAAT